MFYRTAPMQMRLGSANAWLLLISLISPLHFEESFLVSVGRKWLLLWLTGALYSGWGVSGSRDVPCFRGTYFGKYGIIGIQFNQNGNVHEIMGMNFATRRNLESSHV